RVLVQEQAAHGDDAEPVRQADMEADAGRDEKAERRQVERARAEERSSLTEARGPRVQALAPVDVHVEERVEEVEAGDPRRHCGAERPRLPGQRALDRGPGSDRRESV